jgi:two-component system, chemotaxis family, sensor kinase CheA
VLARGLMSAEQLAALSESEALNLIFMPGLSTAEQVSDVSGRGVGTDVVKTMVESVGGSVELSSRKGEGCCTQLRLPMSMAVSQVITVKVEGQRFGVPMDSILETVRVDSARLHGIKASEAFVLRDKVIPLVRLRQRLALPARTREGSEETVLVVRGRAGECGLVVDDFDDKVEVILKPLDGVLAGIHAYSGSALLGDGSVLLVLNLKELV